MRQIGVICDTNFWQGWNEVKNPVKHGYNIYSTWAVIEELFKSPQFAKVPKHKSSAILKAGKKLLYHTYPFEHIYRTLTSRQLIGKSEFLKYGADYLIKIISAGKLLEQDKMNLLIKLGSKRAEGINRWNDLVSAVIKDELYPKILHRRAYFIHDHVPMTKDFIKTSTEMEIRRTLDKELNWDNLQLFYLVMDRYLKEITLKNRVPQNNDWYDLFMLSYVQPHLKYYTEEKFWRKIIVEVGMGHYLVSKPDFLHN